MQNIAKSKFWQHLCVHVRVARARGAWRVPRAQARKRAKTFQLLALYTISGPKNRFWFVATGEITLRDRSREIAQSDLSGEKKRFWGPEMVYKARSLKVFSHFRACALRHAPRYFLFFFFTRTHTRTHTTDVNFYNFDLFLHGHQLFVFVFV